VGVVAACTGLVMSAAADPGVPVNPVRPVSAGDAALDPSHHFLVLVEQNAGLYHNEAEGSILVGGDVSWRSYQVVPKSTPYTVPGDNAPAGLVVRGAIDFVGSTNGSQTLAVQQNTNAYLAGLANATVVPNGGITYVVPPGGNGNTRPVLAVHKAQTSMSMARDPGFDVPALFSTYRTLAGQLAACANTVDFLDQNGSGPWPGSGNATIRLRPGQNVLNTTVAQLKTLQNVNLDHQRGLPELGAARREHRRAR